MPSRLFGVVFAGVGLLNLVGPRETTAYAIRRRAGGPIEGQIEPTGTRLLFTWATGGVVVVVVGLGLGLATGLLGP